MKLSAFHKARGDTVEQWTPIFEYDIVYKAKVFTDSVEDRTIIRADRVVAGGTGYGLDNTLPAEVEHIYPDYSLYNISDTAYGFLTRGCPRQCPFCIVSEKEGCQSQKVADLPEFWRGQKYIKLLDPNLLAAPEHEELLTQLIDSGTWVDFTQGLDIRLLDEYSTELLLRVKAKNIHFAWDNPRQDLTGHFKRFAENYKRYHNVEKPDKRKLTVYVLVNYNSTLEEDLYRIYTLRDLGYWPYVMVYDKPNAPDEIRRLQRWVDRRAVFETVRRFEDCEG